MLFSDILLGSLWRYLQHIFVTGTPGRGQTTDLDCCINRVPEKSLHSYQWKPIQV